MVSYAFLRTETLACAIFCQYLIKCYIPGLVFKVGPIRRSWILQQHTHAHNHWWCGI